LEVLCTRRFLGGLIMSVMASFVVMVLGCGGFCLGW